MIMTQSGLKTDNNDDESDHNNVGEYIAWIYATEADENYIDSKSSFMLHIQTNTRDLHTDAHAHVWSSSCSTELMNINMCIN